MTRALGAPPTVDTGRGGSESNVNGVTRRDRVSAELERRQACRNEVAVFAEADDVDDATGALAVLGHRALSALSSEAVAVAMLRAHAINTGDDEVIAACNDLDELLGQVVVTLRDRVIRRARTSGGFARAAS